MERDHVDHFLAQWADVRPDLDPAPMAVVGRLHRLAQLLEDELRPVFAEEGLGNGDFDVLASLRRAGSPYRLTPGELTDSLLVTSGAVTKRVDRLARRGLVTRSVSASDGRGRVVELTPAGIELTDRLAARHWANEDRLMTGLSARQRTELRGLLRTWLLALEGPATPT